MPCGPPKSRRCLMGVKYGKEITGNQNRAHAALFVQHGGNYEANTKQKTQRQHTAQKAESISDKHTHDLSGCHRTDRRFFRLQIV